MRYQSFSSLSGQKKIWPKITMINAPKTWLSNRFIHVRVTHMNKLQWSHVPTKLEWCLYSGNYPQRALSLFHMAPSSSKLGHRLDFSEISNHEPWNSLGKFASCLSLLQGPTWRLLNYFGVQDWDYQLDILHDSNKPHKLRISRGISPTTMVTMVKSNHSVLWNCTSK